MEVSYDSDGKYLGRLGDVFGDPTRRAIYRHLRGADAPLSATEVAEAFGLHRTVARAHLEKLAELGLVESGTRRRPSGGRPAKTYVLAGDRLEVMLPPRRYERLARLLLRLVDSSMEPSAAAAAALSLGVSFGEETALDFSGGDGEQPARLAPRAVAAWMDEAGYSVSLDDSDGGIAVLEVRNCVYRELAVEYPDLVCNFDRGMFCGMLGVDPAAHHQTHALSRGDDFCRHEFRL